MKHNLRYKLQQYLWQTPPYKTACKSKYYAFCVTSHSKTEIIVNVVKTIKKVKVEEADVQIIIIAPQTI